MTFKNQKHFRWLEISGNVIVKGSVFDLMNMDLKNYKKWYCKSNNNNGENYNYGDTDDNDDIYTCCLYKIWISESSGLIT